MLAAAITIHTTTRLAELRRSFATAMTSLMELASLTDGTRLTDLDSTRLSYCLELSSLRQPPRDARHTAGHDHVLESLSASWATSAAWAISAAWALPNDRARS